MQSFQLDKMQSFQLDKMQREIRFCVVRQNKISTSNKYSCRLCLILSEHCFVLHETKNYLQTFIIYFTVKFDHSRHFLYSFEIKLFH